MIVEGKEIPGIYYLYLHSKVYEKTHGNSIHYRELLLYLYQWKIPKKLRPLIIKELKELELIKKNKHEFELARPLIHEDNINEYYEKMGMYDKGK